MFFCLRVGRLEWIFIVLLVVVILNKVGWGFFKIFMCVILKSVMLVIVFLLILKLFWYIEMWGVVDIEDMLLVMFWILKDGKFIVCFWIWMLGKIWESLLSFMILVCFKNLLFIIFIVIGIFIMDCLCICVVIVIFFI